MDRNKSAYKLKDFGPLYIINLDGQPERWQWMKDQLDYWQVTNYERISAFDGREDDLSEIISGRYPDAVSSGEVGCVTSHLKSIKHWYETTDTEYGNLVLLSDGEAHPLVCMEALASGLGVVVCQWGKANLDTSKEFITVIEEKHINDIDFIEYEIEKNRKYSVEHRDEIREYGKQFDWVKIIEKYYLPNVEKVIEKHG